MAWTVTHHESGFIWIRKKAHLRKITQKEKNHNSSNNKNKMEKLLPINFVHDPTQQQDRHVFCKTTQETNLRQSKIIMFNTAFFKICVFKHFLQNVVNNKVVETQIQRCCKLSWFSTSTSTTFYFREKQTLSFSLSSSIPARSLDTLKCCYCNYHWNNHYIVWTVSQILE